MRRLHAAWANLPLRGKGLVVAAVPVLALLVAVFSLYAAQSDATRAQAAVRRVLVVRHQIRSVEVLLLDAETGIDGFVLTRREAFLAPYSQSFRKLSGSITRLKNVIGENPSQLVRANRLSALTGQKLELLGALRAGTTGELELAPGEKQRLLIESNALMGELRAVIADMRAEERQRLERNLAEVGAAQGRQRLATQGAVVIGLVGGLIVAWLFATGIVRRVRRLSENAHRLVNEQPLLPLPPGEDEIGRLGQALGAAGSLLIEREHHLMQAKEEAESANQAKSEFLSRTSHELRTPLNATLGFAQLLRMRELGPPERESVDQIVTAGRHLLELINDVLDIARIEAGELSIAPANLRLGDAVGDALGLVRPLAAKENVRLEDHTAPEADRRVLADPQRLKQILLNLLSNAIKYNHPGGLVRLEARLESPSVVRITIADTGLGLQKEQLEKLFTPFERLGAEKTPVEGTGLGLALSQALAQLMGGRIGATSVPGHGSDFWVDLPLAAPDTTEASAEVALESMAVKHAEQPFTVLYVEDDASNLTLVEQILAYRPGIRLLHAALGSTGIELARRHRPDLVLLDLHLPDKGGEEMLEALLRATNRVVVISADATNASIGAALAAGADGYLTKPLDVRRFLEVVDETVQLAR